MKSKIALGTLRRMEAADEPSGSTRTETLIRVTTALEKGGVEFLNGDQPGVRLKRM